MRRRRKTLPALPVPPAGFMFAQNNSGQYVHIERVQRDAALRMSFDETSWGEDYWDAEKLKRKRESDV